MTAAEKPNEKNILDFLLSKYIGKVNFCDIRDKSAGDNYINISSNTEPNVIFEKAKKFDIFHSVQEDSFSPDKSINLAAFMITNPQKFLEDPICSILNPNQETNVKINMIFEKDFFKLDEKYSILEDIEKAVMTHIKSGSLIYDVQSISDEFITNAIFHSTSIIEDRKEYIEQGKLGNIKLAVSEDELLISVTDPHGTLKPSKLFNRIHTCYTSEIADKINMGQGGAGIGSFLVHGMSASYIVAVQENIQTIVSSVLPLKMGNRKRTKLSKNLHILYVEEKHNG